ncbi:hypothetical protein [Maritalea porphyrae]|uniref:GIY-YIG nuclease family protein n=1 Tax=Maritalea porphyrae TaxID=880732 RepID=A0ABQ5UNW8_9HYPH|nr:hypothetical protein [Maritalea porphyrae]GLQ16983.1 hypothetical protein GCM10007879_12320 [Maritalea porphyrae]
MIIFIGTNRQRSNITRLRKHQQAPKFAFKSYNWLFRTFKLPAATYVFTGIDRLDANERRLAGKVFRHIRAAGKGFSALNDPAHGKGRYRLLCGLYGQGLNAFNAYLAIDDPKPERFPVFIRRNSISTAPLSTLLNNQLELDHAINQLAEKAEPLDDLVIIEFCADQFAPGVHQKFSMYKIGDQVFQSFINVGKSWLVKYDEEDLLSEEQYALDRQHIEQNRFAAHFREVFELANVDYGRADFGLFNGQPQTYEINFNPFYLIVKSEVKSTQRRMNEDFVVEKRTRAIADLASHGGRAIDNISDPDITAFRLRPWRNYAPQRY